MDYTFNAIKSSFAGHVLLKKDLTLLYSNVISVLLQNVQSAIEKGRKREKVEWDSLMRFLNSGYFAKMLLLIRSALGPF